eukprot:TRINITY_DN10104_c0_g1_i4.p1 TRINITY_DN10104_c0_g1~~TRINITY_DN10104_c0_g1_i4.p1  ORF type:complete len:145 (-),score=1.24 TRINITY_DN10104_c0_g1_i4:48-482(-)
MPFLIILIILRDPTNSQLPQSDTACTSHLPQSDTACTRHSSAISLNPTPPTLATRLQTLSIRHCLHSLYVCRLPQSDTAYTSHLSANSSNQPPSPPPSLPCPEANATLLVADHQLVATVDQASVADVLATQATGKRNLNSRQDG